LKPYFNFNSLNFWVFSLIKDIDSIKKSDFLSFVDTIDPTGYFIEQTSFPSLSNPQYSPMMLITSFTVCIKNIVGNAGELLNS
jgi:hypothetical protein